MKGPFVIAVLAVALCHPVKCSLSEEYCSPKMCHRGQRHTLCANDLTKWSPNCIEPDRNLSVVTAKDVELILKVANDYRRKVALGLETRGRRAQPPASNMRKLTWSDELARIAQVHVQQCEFKMDSCPNTRDYSGGQNLYSRLSTASFDSNDWQQVLDSWYSSVDKMDPGYVDLFPKNSRDIGLYTQLVWAQSYHIGCGVSTYMVDDRHRQLYACNYGPAGNVFTLSVYKKGKAGSACPQGTLNDNGLCS